MQHCRNHLPHKLGSNPFLGQVELIFKVQFEEFHEVLKTRATGGLIEGNNDEENKWCIASRNEVMRFHCFGFAEDGGAYNGGGCAWLFSEKKGAAICTFSNVPLPHL